LQHKFDELQMRDIIEIQSRFPTLYEILGETYIESLKSEQGALSKRATINPFFTILYCTSNNQQSDLIESCFKDALDKKSISIERLKRFRDEKQHVNLQNFINEIVTLKPVFAIGGFLDEMNNGVTPDFLAKLSELEIVFECVSVNESSDSEKQRNKEISDAERQYQIWKKDNQNGGVFTTIHEQSPYGDVSIDKIIDKIRKKKSSRQVKDFQYKVMVMSFRNMMFADSSECLPNKSNHVDGIHTGLIYHAFYGKRGDIIFQGNSFEGERHKLSTLNNDGKFRRNSDYNLCILNFETKDNEKYKEYAFFENLQKPLPEDIINKLCDAFSPYETHSILKKYIEQ
jgi:hypothetical protein